jgi:phosphoribosylaminoimidazole-succinocarboxamide synthase
MTSSALHTSALTSLPLLARGKVRDNYAVGKDRLLMVASDRLSAFDVILGEPIPGKGALLTQMALFWFDKLGDLCPNHLTGEAPESVVTPAEVPQVTGRSMLVKRLKPIPVEAVVRGYLAGSGRRPSSRRRPRRRSVNTTKTSASSRWSRLLAPSWPRRSAISVSGFTKQRRLLR